VETIQLLADKGVTHMLECGPGKVLTGLNKRINKDITTVPVYDPDTLETALSALVPEERG
jgi:[acyl-carrier-protein] S-malonyltransferase